MNSLGEDTEDKSKNDAPSYASAMIDGPKLLNLARKAIENYLLLGKLPPESQRDPQGHTNNGLFVTLWACQRGLDRTAPDEQLALRGCIGQLEGKIPFESFVQEVAIAAATRDPRFLPLSESELDSIRIEIAILSPLREVSSLEEVRIGEDGLLIEGMGRRGLLLPKVATRLGWDQRSFLQGVCQKAGLPLNAWPDHCKLYAFTTAVLEEDDCGKLH